MSEASLISMTRYGDREKVYYRFCDRQSSGKKHKRKSSLTITQRKCGHHKPVYLTSVNQLLQKLQNKKQ